MLLSLKVLKLRSIINVATRISIRGGPRLKVLRLGLVSGLCLVQNWGYGWIRVRIRFKIRVRVMIRADFRVHAGLVLELGLCVFRE